MSDREKREAYDLAEGRLLHLASYYTKFVDDEEQKAIPDTEKITQWENERRALLALARELNAEDQEAVANVNATYGPVLRAFMGKE